MADTASAQQTQPAPPVVDSPHELDKIKASCGTFAVVDCGIELLTGQPLHIAVGSLAPQNGFGAGLAFLGHKTTDDWRINWDADGLASTKGWRVGWYGKFVHATITPPGVHFGTGGQPASNPTELPEHLVVSLTAQMESLDNVGFFGTGPDSSTDGEVFFGMREAIVGAAIVKPFTSFWHPSLYGEVNGRFVRTTAPATMPELSDTRGFLQTTEGVRVRPTFAGSLVHLKYDVALRDYVAPADSTFTFHTLTVDLTHDISLHSTTVSAPPSDENGPDDCTRGTNPAHPSDCAITRNVEGTVELRAFMSAAFVPDGHTMPFYFQPTLGGSDINGTMALAGYQDYRFRAPNQMFVRASIEHSIFDWPVGVMALVDAGRVALTRGDLFSMPWRYSVAGGVTIRAGGIPAVQILYARSGTEGGHAIFVISTTLLGGSSRPAM
jgi:hypothetical protein